jgi:hypothetical protein
MNTCQIITAAGHPIGGLGPWRHSERGRPHRIIHALNSYGHIAPWAYITFTEWTRPQAHALCKHLNDALVYRHWNVLDHKYGIILYYEPALLVHRGPDSFEIPAPYYHYPFKQCILKGNWFKVRSGKVASRITKQNCPRQIYRYALDPAHGHIIYRAL